VGAGGEVIWPAVGEQSGIGSATADMRIAKVTHTAKYPNPHSACGDSVAPTAFTEANAGEKWTASPYGYGPHYCLLLLTWLAL
jgi:hypothetical protein